MSNKFVLSNYTFGTIGTYQEIPIDALTNPDHALTQSQIHRFASIPASLSESFKNGSIPPSTHFSDGRCYIGKVMTDLDHTFLHVFTELNREYLREDSFRDFFRKKLEDPGALYVAVYFDIANDPTTIAFYWHAWHGDVDKCMDFYHNRCWSLYYKCGPVDKSSAWHHVNTIDGVGNNERIKIADFVTRLQKTAKALNRPLRITCLNSGGFPERHYGLPEADMTIIGNENAPQLNQLFPDSSVRSRVRYIRDDLLTTIEHPELFGRQDVVTMFGTVASFGEKNAIQIILFGVELLHDKGVIAFDLLIMNESLRRLLSTRLGAPTEELRVFDSAGEAMAVGMDIVNTANEQLEPRRIILTAEPPIVTKVGAWGATGVRFYLKKHVL
ncbi:hypothetical protein IKE86_01495 [Candidatus Saccharibacteria bacterium]|nr:hypothetical protein [Candidatus Saccharibacteria bacterium]